ncbi:MAG: hypothetical protein AAGB22_06120, partial [Bacteroidota bacterium]
MSTRLVSSGVNTPGGFASIAIDAQGNTIVSGYFSDSLFIDNVLMATGSSGISDAFVAKFDASGTNLCLKVLTNASFMTYNNQYSVLDVSTDSSGATYWVARHTANASFEGTTLPNSGFMVAKINSSGQLSWLQSIPALMRKNMTHMSASQKLTGQLEFLGSLTIGGSSYSSGSAPSANVIFQMDTSGTFQWTRLVSANSVQGLIAFALVSNDSGDVFFAFKSGLPAVVDFENGPSYLTQGGNRTATIASYSDNGGFQWFREVRGSVLFSATTLQVNTGEKLNVAGEYVGDVTLGNTMLSDSGNNATAFYSAMALNANQITGTVFRDLNGNNIQDPGEDGLSLWVATQPSQALTTSTTSGAYRAFEGVGNFSVSLPSPPRHHTVAPASHSVSFAALGQSDTANNFACAPIPGINDLQFFATIVTRSRPGFDVRYRLLAKNAGTTALNATVSFTYDSLLTYNNSTLNPDMINGRQFTWDLNNFQPWTEQAIELNFTLSAMAPLGDELLSYGAVTPITGDTVEADNVDTSRVIITGAYDPNDKRVMPAGSISPDQVAESQWLTYTVRFQNTGTDTAFTVVIRDTLSDDLDLATFEMIDASHNQYFRFDGSALAVYFEQILLPDSNINEPLSHGFVKFRIRVKNTLSLGDVVENTAHIYFDFNKAIVTNTTATEVMEPVSTQADILLESPQFRVYPNPGDGTFSLSAQGLGPGPVRVTATDLLGKEIANWAFSSADEAAGATLTLDASPG